MGEASGMRASALRSRATARRQQILLTDFRPFTLPSN